MANENWKEKSWREVTPRTSEFLGTWDIPELFEGSMKKTVTIKDFATVDKINGRAGKAIVMYVEEYQKGIVLNAGNKQKLSLLYKSVRVAGWKAGAKVNLVLNKNNGGIGYKIGIGIELIGADITELWVNFNSAATKADKRKAANMILEATDPKEKEKVRTELAELIKAFEEKTE
jgi:hypothetical protein